MDPGSPVLAAEVDYDRKVSYALQQNSVPVVKIVRLHNRGPAPLEDVRLRILVEPFLAIPWEARIARIDPGSTNNPERVEVPVSPQRLVNLLEREWGRRMVVRSPHRFRLRVDRPGGSAICSKDAVDHGLSTSTSSPMARARGEVPSDLRPS